jgi:hypothetical protein
VKFLFFAKVLYHHHKKHTNKEGVRRCDGKEQGIRAAGGDKMRLFGEKSKRMLFVMVYEILLANAASGGNFFACLSAHTTTSHHHFIPD